MKKLAILFLLLLLVSCHKPVVIEETKITNNLTNYVVRLDEAVTRFEAVINDLELLIE